MIGRYLQAEWFRIVRKFLAFVSAGQIVTCLSLEIDKHRPNIRMALLDRLPDFAPERLRYRQDLCLGNEGKKKQGLKSLAFLVIAT
ncbi:hypothetical protein [uncultured Cohaesibacter sp.]|uniref:hypothetical protein n=1 Tax=uncultured Cohaesibacter sp. TaxID=1002546 RepID=UPI0029C78301|nr:hypothetical protein [uncultured Cohaesibacter sp.]